MTDSLAVQHALLGWLDASMQPIATAGGWSLSRLEGLAFVLSLWMVVLNLRVNAWGWPLAMISSLLYGALFARSGLYGEAWLQVFFGVVGAWGWWQWLRRPVPGGEGVEVDRLTRAGWCWAGGWTLALWPLLAWGLGRFTDSEVPWSDALPTAGSLVGQWLLARKRVENWVWWLWVNLFSVGLFAWKGLWLTVVLYATFAVLSWIGWQAWRRLADASAGLANHSDRGVP